MWSLTGIKMINHYVYPLVRRGVQYRFGGETTMDYTDTENTGVPMVPQLTGEDDDEQFEETVRSHLLA